MGWNGVKIHCLGQAFELYKGDTFTSETEGAEIMVDVHDSRVLLKWPSVEPKILTPSDSERSWESESSPTGRVTSRAGPASGQSRSVRGPQSPISPRPHASPLAQPPQQHSSGFVEIYEDDSSEEVKDVEEHNEARADVVCLSSTSNVKVSFEVESFKESDEENDPIIHSFGPYGANLNNRLEAISATLSPGDRRPLRLMDPAKKITHSPQRSIRIEYSPNRVIHSKSTAATLLAKSTKAEAKDDKLKDIADFAIKHLMYSPLSATPLSTILSQVLAHQSSGRDTSNSNLSDTECSLETLDSLLEPIPCIGSVRREGKDAAGKTLESEYYYMPEQDEDAARRSAVQSLGIGARGLRNCRKSHKASHFLESTSPILIS